VEKKLTAVWRDFGGGDERRNKNNRNSWIRRAVNFLWFLSELQDLPRAIPKRGGLDLLF
jgi:hypothetical protein